MADDIGANTAHNDNNGTEEEPEEHPVGLLYREYFKTRKKDRKSFDFEPHRVSVCSFLDDVMSESYCFGINQREGKLGAPA